MGNQSLSGSHKQRYFLIAVIGLDVSSISPIYTRKASKKKRKKKSVEGKRHAHLHICLYMIVGETIAFFGFWRPFFSFFLSFFFYTIIGFVLPVLLGRRGFQRPSKIGRYFIFDKSNTMPSLFVTYRS